MNENMNDEISLEELLDEAAELEDEIEDFEANEKIEYQVWALGYDENEDMTDCNLFLKAFSDPASAIMFAKTTTLTDILEEVATAKFDMTNVDYFNLEVETVVPYEDEEDGDENIDTIWETQILI